MVVLFFKAVDCLACFCRIVQHRGRQLGYHLGNLCSQLFDADAACSRDNEYILITHLFDRVNELVDDFLRYRIALVGSYDLRTGSELCVELFELFVDRLEILERLSSVSTRQVDHMDEQSGTLDVAEEVVT